MIAIARKVAFRVLSEIEKSAKYTNLALQQAYRDHPMEQRDRALCTEIVYGTIQRRRSLDAMLQEVCHRPLEKLDDRVLHVLRMTSYQLTYLNRVPAYAALNDAVELCKAHVPRAAGFVNGVLRAYARDKRTSAERLEQIASQYEDWAERMGILYSYPNWIVRLWETEFGQTRTVEMMQSCNEPSPFSVRVNTKLANPAEVTSNIQLEENDDQAAPSALSPYGLRLPRGINVEDWQMYEDGLVTVQDEGSMLIAPLLQPTRHPRILDMCAGLGTKTTQISELQDEVGSIDAVDIHQHKLQKLQLATERLHLPKVKIIVADGRSLPQRRGMKEQYDAVLLDAPCSGLGVLRRRPDIKWRRKEEDLSDLVDLQVALLQAAVQLVRQGGVLVYATCTLNRAENQGVIQRVLSTLSDQWQWDDITTDLPDTVGEGGFELDEGLLLTPEQFGTDGFYMARLRKHP